MDENTPGENTPQLAFAVGKQPGPDGKTLVVSLHIGSAVMSAAIAIPADRADEFADQLCKDIKKTAREARISNSGLIVRGGV